MIMCKNLDVASSKPSEIGSQSFLALENDTNKQHIDKKNWVGPFFRSKTLACLLEGMEMDPWPSF